VLQAARRFEDALPAGRVRPRAGRREVPTRVLDEDTYPVGGFASLSNRGSLESLLQSQLAFMEPSAGAAQRPDLFDVKYLRDELLYYSRDENQFLRRRRAFVVVLTPDLVHARFKDVDLPTQRVVLAIGLLVAAVRRLTEWLSEDALVFEFLFVADGESQPLAQEMGLMAMVFREAVANGTVRLAAVASPAAAEAVCRERARRSLCHVLTVGVAPPALEAEGTEAARLTVDGAAPALAVDGEAIGLEGDDPLGVWGAVLERLLQLWV
jgi:vWA domain found in the FtsH ternary systems